MFERKLVAIILLSSLIALPITLRPVCAEGPYLQWIKEYYLVPLIDTNPHGRLNVIVDIYQLMNDGSPNYNWFFYVVKMQTVPGKVAYGSDWETADTTANHVVWSYAAGYEDWLVDYDPTTSNSEYSASASVTVSLEPSLQPQGPPSVSFTYTYTYSVPYVKVVDQSDYSEYRARWIHDFAETRDPPNSPSDSTYQAKPGFVIKANQGSGSYIDAQYKVTWGHPVWWGLWWEYASFQSDVIYLDVYSWEVQNSS